MNRIQELLELYGLEYTEYDGMYTALIDGKSYLIHGLSHLTCLFRGFHDQQS